MQGQRRVVLRDRSNCFITSAGSVPWYLSPRQKSHENSTWIRHLFRISGLPRVSNYSYGFGKFPLVLCQLSVWIRPHNPCMQFVKWWWEGRNQEQSLFDFSQNVLEPYPFKHIFSLSPRNLKGAINQGEIDRPIGRMTNYDTRSRETDVRGEKNSLFVRLSAIADFLCGVVYTHLNRHTRMYYNGLKGGSCRLGKPERVITQPHTIFDHRCVQLTNIIHWLSYLCSDYLLENSFFPVFTEICHIPQQQRRRRRSPRCFLLRLEITWFVVSRRHLNPPRIFLRAATFNPQKMTMMMSYSIFVHRAVFAPTT